MKKILSFLILYCLACTTYGQLMSVEDIFSLTAYSPSKFDNYLSHNNFTITGKDNQNDTLLRNYDNGRSKGHNDSGFISRALTRADIKDDTYLTYQTQSAAEFYSMAAEFKHAGFYCNKAPADTLAPQLYQHKDRCVRTSIATVDGAKIYSLQFHKKLFPRPKDIYYADDLLTFTSHEYLVAYFGEKNVKKDNYFLTGNEIIKCSVLFWNTSRQVVFIWADEENQCSIASLLFGGQQNLKSSLESKKYVEQNNWVLKSGVRPGMSLLQLRMLNGNDFSFHGGNSRNSGSVIPGKQGKLDFKKEEIILGCLNCHDDKYSNAKVVNADDSIEEGRILFVLSIILNPS